MGLRAEILDNIGVENPKVNIIDSEHLGITEEDWLEASWELGLSIWHLWKGIDMMDFAS